MACSCGNCNSCRNLVRSTSITLSGNILTITIPTTTLINKQCLCVVLAQTIPSTVTADTIVQIADGASTLNVFTPCDNFLYADQLTCRKVLRLRIATDTLVAKLRSTCAIRCTRHVFSSIPAAAAAAAAADTGVTT